jgi:hypothetical protein
MTFPITPFLDSFRVADHSLGTFALFQSLGETFTRYLDGRHAAFCFVATIPSSSDQLDGDRSWEKVGKAILEAYSRICENRQKASIQWRIGGGPG